MINGLVEHASADHLGGLVFQVNRSPTVNMTDRHATSIWWLGNGAATAVEVLSPHNGADLRLLDASEWSDDLRVVYTHTDSLYVEMEPGVALDLMREFNAMAATELWPRLKLEGVYEKLYVVNQTTLIGMKRGGKVRCSGWRFHSVTVPRAVLAERLGQRKDHYMPASLLDSQLAALEPLGPDEPGITVPGIATPEVVVDYVLGVLAREHGVPIPPPLPS